MPDPILAEGRNCWRIVPSPRVAFLVDGAAYFEALATALEGARESVLIAGWEIDDRIRLRHGTEGGTLPDRLGPLLDALLRRHRGLRVDVLAWDFAMIYALERGFAPIFRLGWRSHPRLRFHLDSRHPPGASHHQKIVVVDDGVAFAGGLDLARRRWDTPEHRPRDPRRADPDGRPYPPFHDVQVAVSGEAAAALGDLVRRRWRRATGRRLEAPSRRGEEAWPPGLEPDLEDVEVAIARTEPADDGQEEAREVESLYRDAIASARRVVYAENQYFTSSAVTEALARRLAEESGPEVILVLPRRCPGWLEEHTMGQLRARRLTALRKADRFGRLHVCYPVVGGGEEDVYVHAKVLVVDDRLARVGSANLNNRSLGLDTECDIAIEAGDGSGRAAVARFRDRLVAEHLGIDAKDLARAVASDGSLAAAIRRLGEGSERTLRPLEEAEPGPGPLEPEDAFVDPERPIAPDELIAQFAVEEAERGARNPWLRAAMGLLALGALAAAWRFTPLRESLDTGAVLSAAARLRESPLAPIGVLGGYAVGGLLMVPITLLIAVTALTFPPLPAFLLALAGASGSAAVGFGLGRLLGRDTLRRVAGGRLNRVSRRLARRGTLAVVAARLLPLGPFTMVNAVAGATHIDFRDFLKGTVVGLTPGILAMVVFADGLERTALHPDLTSLGWLAAVLLAIVLGFAVVRRWLREGE
jgi:phospholipase D1/2